MKNKAAFEELLHAPQMLRKSPHIFFEKFNFPLHYAKGASLEEIEGENKEIIKVPAVSDGEGGYKAAFTAVNSKGRPLSNELTSEFEVYLNNGEYLKMLTSYSHRIQQAQKFSVPCYENEMLTQGEFDAVMTDTTPFLPYEETFVEFDFNNHVFYCLFKAWEEDEDDIRDTKPFSVVTSMYEKREKYWVIDLCPYYYEVAGANTVKTPLLDRLLRRKNPKFSKDVWNAKTKEYEQIEGGSFFYNFNIPKEFTLIDLIDDSKDSKGRHSNKQLNDFMNTIVISHMMFCVLLDYPSLSHETKVSGRLPAVYPLAKKTNYSSMRERPAWEHKVLEIDLYGEKEASANGVANGGSPKAFHSVRKHLRRLPDGKKIFVKAHFRGSRQIGVINKEYKFKERKNA